MVRVRALIVMCVCVSQAAGQLRSPPRIVKQPPSDELLFQVAQFGEVHKPFIIECEAEGEPAPKYQWIKDGKPFHYQNYNGRIVMQPGHGTLLMKIPQNEDQGQYQCFSENELGVATSNSVYVRKAELNSTEYESVNIVKAQEGEPFKLTCKPPKGYPKPVVYWVIQGHLGQLKNITNPRITADPDGNLWFSNVTRSDASDDFAYTCVVRSLVSHKYTLADKVFLKVSPQLETAEKNHETLLQYVTRNDKVVNIWKTVELFCIFGGTPLPQIVWKKDGGTLLSSDRITQGNYGKSLIIKRVNYEDEGSYICEASNGVGSAKTYSINLKIQAAPYFTVEPQLKNAAEDETVEILCEASGYPEPQIKWIHNGKPIDEAPPNERRTVTDNTIVIRNLVKKDTGNYGCNATNALGYVYKDVYVNVQ